ncbi:hypothetical protein UFOVP597_27 [uncultured Caudovirales phage]|uniref:Uncharacterized protein n=1 Tax=uncultured Caudovirales phage TaxID=2100421 RepID=A0A6J5MYW4_9CAUD|nr:hypothetical protein UFOVP597_27 [uncultured Caudovirales phage]
MKNVNQVIELLNKAVQSNNESKTWFFSYSGHVKLIDVRLYPEGWRSYDQEKEKGEPKVITKGCYTDNEESVQELYYWIKFNLSDQL